MLSEERFAKIISIVEAKNTVTVAELCTLCGVSESTIRRDITTLDAQGLLNKVFGGACAKDSVFRAKDDSVSTRLQCNKNEKMRIGQYAASLIYADDFVYLDAGTTTSCIIDFISEKQAMFVTNSVYHAKRLSEKGMRVFILGGEIKQSTQAVIGAEALESLAKYHFTKGFWGTNGVSISTGFNTPDVNEALVKKTALSRTCEKYIVCDPSKFSQISCVSFADFAQAQIITTQINQSAYKNCTNITEVDAL